MATTRAPRQPAQKRTGALVTIDSVKDLADAIRHDIIARHEGRKERRLPKGLVLRTDNDHVDGYVGDAEVFRYTFSGSCMLDELLTALGIPCEGV